jgi:hypothetical protein
MAVTQSIASVDQGCGSSVFISTAHEHAISDVQLVCITLVGLMLLYIGYRLIDGVISRTCIGCNRLKKCEKRIAMLEGRSHV